ncbi:hypothetical protein BDP27DRAFT_1424082 [Rhodocollybia butyracea]|uniref:Uncharacterized protein n=1 Tax=Rhodocollybia butyracea TaxID=206335 RepID=A0A9P5PPH3_9AGAR|nr:hypothetical protein BDP27DRAFT_1424082 [Rhodocollybia butyracea]
MHFSTALCAFVAMLACMSSASPVPTTTPDVQGSHILYPRYPTVPAKALSLVVGKIVAVPLIGASGVTNRVAKTNMHLAATTGSADRGRYPIAYISHNTSGKSDIEHTKEIRLSPEIDGLDGKITLKPGWKSSAVKDNIYEYENDRRAARLVTPEEVAEMKKVWSMPGAATTGGVGETGEASGTHQVSDSAAGETTSGAKKGSGSAAGEKTAGTSKGKKVTRTNKGHGKKGSGGGKGPLPSLAEWDVHILDINVLTPWGY